MPATSACCRRTLEGPAATRGFTLLELLVVLVLVALVTSVVGPAALRQIDAVRERGVEADLVAALESLPLQALASGELQSHDEVALSARLPDLPDGWRIVPERPLRYSGIGVAEGGTVSLLVPGQAPRRWRVAAGTGAVDGPLR